MMPAGNCILKCLRVSIMYHSIEHSKIKISAVNGGKFIETGCRRGENVRQDTS